MKFDVEAIIFHVSINSCTRVPFFEIHTLTMSLANLDHQFKNRKDSSLGSTLMFELIIIFEMQLKFLLEEIKSLI
jgi:hypothetical protein